ncbi:MAG TPA: hypothetical protein PLZ98_09150, partial [Chitinophagaceae bacterium]|nr:hypothetical protein [Chitinophagaceae bacterium]
MKKHLPFLCLACMLVILSCTFKLKTKIKYFTNEQTLNYVKEKNYPFDYILKFKTEVSYKSRKKHKINSMNFLNFYAKNNQLIKASD